MSSAPSLLSAPGAGKPSRAVSAVVAKPARGFLVFRIDGYSWTKALPGGERITSQLFAVGGRTWQIDYYPNGTDGNSDDVSGVGSIAVYLRMQNTHKVERVCAQYKFSLLDLAGNAAYELPAETAIFTSVGRSPNQYGAAAAAAALVVEEDRGRGYEAFISKEDLEKRRDSLLREDCLAIRCDVGVPEVTAMDVGPNVAPPPRVRNNYGGAAYGYDDGAEFPDDEHLEAADGGGGSNKKGRRAEPDDKEYIRRCLSGQRRK